MSKIQFFLYEKSSAKSIKDLNMYLMLSICVIIPAEALADW